MLFKLKALGLTTQPFFSSQKSNNILYWLAGSLCLGLFSLNQSKQKSEAFFFSTKKEDISKRAKTIQYNANDPIEDRVVQGNFKQLKGYVAAVLDGHGGYQNAEFISKFLIGAIEESILEELPNKESGEGIDSETKQKHSNTLDN
jgi:hypothetical protein